MSASSSGTGAPSIRSINVRANLLAEWTTDQVRFRAEATRYALGIAICIALVAAVIPAIEGGRASFVHSQQKSQMNLNELKGALDQANAQKKAAEPGVASAELNRQTSIFFDRLMGESYGVLDAAKSGMAFTSVKVEARAAEIVIDCRADAESFDIAVAFAQQAGRNNSKVSSLTGTHPNPLFGKQGVSFEYLKRVAAQ